MSSWPQAPVDKYTTVIEGKHCAYSSVDRGILCETEQRVVSESICYIKFYLKLIYVDVVSNCASAEICRQIFSTL